ncbi:MAG TPA: 2,3-bisphosphoglycerate-independent phosphoglycerate mutase [Casimicrobiaceae bacterium]|nr:2,3-bisphosphoglycerate-independent phosphoglycerate mutase [Casimicrobiaceae bacterium]
MDVVTPSPATATSPQAARPVVRPVVLLILDGFGCREDAPDNAITRADAPHWRDLIAHSPHTTIDASELRVGLPEGQMGNSEVGHLNIGAGRVVYQDFTRIDVAIRDGEFARNPVLTGAVDTARRNRGTVHVLGLVSPGGVHSHERQIAAMVELAGASVPVRVHAFLDGRDTPPRSASASLAFMDATCARLRDARIASLCGRYYAMDRDQRWERTAAAYALLVDGEAPFRASSAEAGLAAAYARGESDEFVKPTAITGAAGTATRMSDGDVVVFMNFRADRARQMTRALTDPRFDGFARARVPVLGAFVCLTRYGDDFAHLPVAFAPQTIRNSFGEYLAHLGLRQLRIAETEKYAHVTYFFNGGIEKVYPGEDRILVPSPKVATYDLKPEMSAFEVADRLVEAIASGRYDAIVCNFANGDMVGHTGNFEAAKHAIEALDRCIGRVVEAARAAGGEVIITADHGNAEMMHDATTGQAHTAHTLNLVPFVYVGRPATLAPRGALQDVAPTMLALMGLPQPPDMTGHSLVHLAAGHQA